MGNVKRFVAMAATVPALTFGWGCVSSTTTNGKPSAPVGTSALVLPKPGPRHVLVDSRWALPASENASATQWLLDDALLAGQDGGAALGKRVQRWPDIAIDLLRGSVAGKFDLPVQLSQADISQRMRNIARVYDQTYAVTDPAAGWSAALAVSSQQSQSYERFRAVRDQLLDMIHSGRFAEASKIDALTTLPSGAPRALRVEAQRLAGLAALLDENPDRAAKLFADALLLAQGGSVHVRFELGLLQAEALRRADRPDAGMAAWKAAIAAGASVRDPELWERALLAKADDVPWPADAAIAGREEPVFFESLAPDAADVLIGIGKMRLTRGAPQLALLAFSRAETESTVRGKRALASLYRAQSMICLAQAPSALPMLEALVQFPDSRIVRRAQAVRGDVFCRSLNDRAQGIALMQGALDYSPTEQWPGKDRLVANLGLYLILDGRREEGLLRLHAAEARFDAAHQWEDLADALKNEAAALRAANLTVDAQLVQQRADEVCTRAGLAVGPLPTPAKVSGDAAANRQ